MLYQGFGLRLVQSRFTTKKKKVIWVFRSIEMSKGKVSSLLSLWVGTFLNTFNIKIHMCTLYIYLYNYGGDLEFARLTNTIIKN